MPFEKKLLDDEALDIAKKYFKSSHDAQNFSLSVKSEIVTQYGINFAKSLRSKFNQSKFSKKLDDIFSGDLQRYLFKLTYLK